MAEGDQARLLHDSDLEWSNAEVWDGTDQPVRAVRLLQTVHPAQGQSGAQTWRVGCRTAAFAGLAGAALVAVISVTRHGSLATADTGSSSVSLATAFASEAAKETEYADVALQAAEFVPTAKPAFGDWPAAPAPVEASVASTTAAVATSSTVASTPPSTTSSTIPSTIPSTTPSTAPSTASSTRQSTTESTSAAPSTSASTALSTATSTVPSTTKSTAPSKMASAAPSTTQSTTQSKTPALSTSSTVVVTPKPQTTSKQTWKWDDAQISDGTTTIPKVAKATCPSNSHPVGEFNADIEGCGLTECNDRYDVDSAQDCAYKCQAISHCISFTWAPKEGSEFN